MGKITRGLAAGLSILAALSLAGCSAFSSGQSTGGASTAVEKKSGSIEIVYLMKQGDQQYFVDEADGAQEAADELGDTKVTVVNLGTDSNKAINELQSALARGVDGIIMVAPDQSIGPRVVQATSEANVPLLASDDILKDASGKEVPFVGFDGTSMGKAVGGEAADLYKETGWTKESTRIISVSKQDLSVCQQRVGGARDAFTSKISDAPEIIDLSSDNSVTDAMNKTGGVVSANQGVENWVVWGCNEESETGVVTGLQNSGVSPDNIIGVGLGGYLACKDWRADKETGNKAALFISGRDVGYNAVKIMGEALRNGTDLPENTVIETPIVDPTNWEEAGVACN